MPLLSNFKKLFTQEQPPAASKDLTKHENGATTTTSTATAVATSAGVASDYSSKDSLRSINVTVSSHSSNTEPSRRTASHGDDHYRTCGASKFTTGGEAVTANSSYSVYPDLPAKYRLLDVLGEGAFSVVYKGIDTASGKPVAIKVINKADLNHKQLNNIKNEIAIMKRLNHPNVLKLLDAHNSQENCFLILEFCDGGEIFNKIIEYTYFSEALSRHVFTQLLSAIEYLHSKNIVHRDIKPENLLFNTIPMRKRSRASSSDKKSYMRKSDDETKVDEGEFEEGVGGGTVGVIKLADFGLAKQLRFESMHKNLKTPCGTAGYTAPEVITCHDGATNGKYNTFDRVSKKNYYSKSVDIWSLGCFLYTIMSGFPPFYDDNPEALTLKILKGDYVFLSPWWDEISNEAKDLISKMLVIKPEERITAEEIWKHPWIKKMSASESAAAAAAAAATSKSMAAKQGGEFSFPDHYFANVMNSKSSFEHVENAGSLSGTITESASASVSASSIVPENSGGGIVIQPQPQQVPRSIEMVASSTKPLSDSEHIENYEAGGSGHASPFLVRSSDNLALLSPRANAIKMVFNNPVIYAKQNEPENTMMSSVVSSSNVKFTDSNFKKNYISSSSDEEDLASYPKTPNPIGNVSFKNVFGNLKEEQEDSEEDDDDDDANRKDEDDEEEEEEDEDDVKSLVTKTKRMVIAPEFNDSEDSINSGEEFEKETRSSSIISGLNGDYKFTLNLNDSSLLGRRKSSKSSNKGSPNPNELGTHTPSLGGAHEVSV